MTKLGFRRELDKKLWTAADRLRSNRDAAVCRHAVPGLILTSTGKVTNDAPEAVEKENSGSGDLPVSVFKERRQISPIVFLT